MQLVVSVKLPVVVLKGPTIRKYCWFGLAFHATFDWNGEGPMSSLAVTHWSAPHVPVHTNIFESYADARVSAYIVPPVGGAVTVYQTLFVYAKLLP